MGQPRGWHGPKHSTARLHTVRKVISPPFAREIPLRTQVGLTLAGRAVGIPHEDPMRNDLKLEDSTGVANISGPASPHRPAHDTDAGRNGVIQSIILRLVAGISAS
jgi:hypothetical protein